MTPSNGREPALQFVFSLNSGRCGTHALAAALRRAGGPEVSAVHEYIDASHFGVVTPDVGLLRRFNTFGYADETRRFWDQRMALILEACAKQGKRVYIETAHMLGKAGLVEWVVENCAGEQDSDAAVAFINITRRPEAVARSIAERAEMSHLANRWLWYLDPKYPRNRVAFEPYAQFAALGVPCWYAAEMRARTSEYERLLATRQVPCIQAGIETPGLADRLLSFFGELGLARHFPNGLAIERSNANPANAQRAELEAECKRILEACGGL